MNNPSFPTITIKPKRQESILRRHPWVFSGAIKKVEGKPGAGDWVKVIANKGALLGWGHFSPGTSIAIRMLTFAEDKPNDQWWIDKIKEAISVREMLGLIESDTNAGLSMLREMDYQDLSQISMPEYWLSNATRQACTTSSNFFARLSLKHLETNSWQFMIKVLKP